MSLTKVSYSLISGAPINVADYGAVGNGVADDTAALQAAFDAAPDNSCITFASGATYRTTSVIQMGPTKIGVVLQGNGALIKADHNGDCLNLTPLNENYGRLGVYNLNLQGPNRFFPRTPAELAGTSTGAGIKLGYDDTSNTPGGYMCTFVNCTTVGFFQGIYLQAALLCNFIGGHSFYNQYGVFIDAGQTNANNFRSFSIRQNRVAGLFTSLRSGGLLSSTTANVFQGCIFESNIPYDASAGGYPSTFDPTTGYGVILKNAYDFVFDACYFENHNYSIVISESSDSNSFNNCYISPGPGGSFGPRPGAIWIAGSGCNNNTFDSCIMHNGQVQNIILSNPNTILYTQILDCSGVNMEPSNVGLHTYIRNGRKTTGDGVGAYFGTIQMPYQGYIDNPGEGINPGNISGIGTNTATLYCFGFGEIQFGDQITGNTTITTISGQRPGQFLVLRNYQTAYSVTLKAAASGTGDIVLTGNADVVFNAFGQQLVLYVTSGLGGNRCYEVGRNF
jgi:hypothetical protein